MANLELGVTKRNQKMPYLDSAGMWHMHPKEKKLSLDLLFRLSSPLDSHLWTLWKLRDFWTPQSDLSFRGFAGFSRPFESHVGGFCFCEIVWKWGCAIFGCLGLHKSKAFSHNFQRVPQAWNVTKHGMPCHLWRTYHRFAITGLRWLSLWYTYLKQSSSLEEFQRLFYWMIEIMIATRCKVCSD